jgi:hypothetical protein
MPPTPEALSKKLYSVRDLIYELEKSKIVYFQENRAKSGDSAFSYIRQSILRQRMYVEIKILKVSNKERVVRNVGCLHSLLVYYLW